MSENRQSKGRDIEPRELNLEFDTHGLSWRYVGDAAEVMSTDGQQLIYDAIKNAPAPLTPAKIISITQLEANYVYVALHRMVDAGKIAKHGHGKYSCKDCKVVSITGDANAEPYKLQTLQNCQSLVLMNPNHGSSTAMLIEMVTETVFKNNGTGQRVTLAPGQVATLPGQLAAKVLEKGKGRPASLPSDCEGCAQEVDGMCYDRIRGIVCADAVHTCRHPGLLLQRPN